MCARLCSTHAHPNGAHDRVKFDCVCTTGPDAHRRTPSAPSAVSTGKINSLLTPRNRGRRTVAPRAPLRALGQGPHASQHTRETCALPGAWTSAKLKTFFCKNGRSNNGPCCNVRLPTQRDNSTSSNVTLQERRQAELSSWLVQQTDPPAGCCVMQIAVVFLLAQAHSGSSKRERVPSELKVRGHCRTKQYMQHQVTGARAPCEAVGSQWLAAARYSPCAAHLLL